MTNGGTAATTSAAVSITNALPGGLIATAIIGTGWTTNLNTLSATRTDVPAAGAAYPPIHVKVNVSSTAASSVTNTATVSGEGGTNMNNNSASDVTAVTALTPANHGGTITSVPRPTTEAPPILPIPAVTAWQICSNMLSA